MVDNVYIAPSFVTLFSVYTRIEFVSAVSVCVSVVANFDSGSLSVCVSISRVCTIGLIGTN